MEIFKGFEQYKLGKPACVTTGTFDGVHIGHKELLSKLANEAHYNSMTSVLVTFDPHPRRVLFPEQDGLQLINTMEEKLSLLEKSGIDSVIVQPFTTEFSRTSALLYVRDMLVSQVGMKKLVIGYDHQFGKNREGSIDNLREMAPVYDFEVDEIPAQVVDDANVSSTKIRYALADGDIIDANRYLGYAFFITGTVVKGEGRGTSLGFPTANIAVEDSKIVPKNGVYAVDVDIAGKTHKGVINIGTKPTFSEGREVNVEVHVMDFDMDLYNQTITVHFKERLRGEVKFDSAEDLKAQMASDVQKALNI